MKTSRTPHNRRRLALGLAVVTAVAIPASANAAAEYIYWSNSVAGGIGRTAADGTGSRDAAFVGSATASGPQFLTVSGNWLYWARSGGIGRVQLGGTGATNSFFTTGVTLRASIASDATYVYFAKAELFNNSLGRVPISGGAANTNFLAVGGSEPNGLVVTGGNFYWNQDTTGSNSTKIATAPASGSGSVNDTWATGASGARGIASDGTYIYWADDTSQRIGRVAIAAPGSPDPTFIMSAATSGIKGLAVDDEYIYWVNQVSPGNDKIGRAKLDGTNRDPSFIQLPGEAYGLAVGTPSAGSYALTVTRDGTGMGTVTSQPAGIDCGATCTASFPSSATVTLIPAANSGSTFTGWGGACAGASTMCSVTMSQARSVTATFATSGASGGTGGEGSSSSSSDTAGPSNAFTITRGKAQASGVVTRVTLPGAGRIVQRGTRAGAGRGANAVKRVTACTGTGTAKRAGAVTVTCRLNAATRAARRRGAVRVQVSTTFTPTGGIARTTTQTVVLPRLATKAK